MPGSNALDTADGIKAKMRELETRFPKGLRYLIGYDTTPFIRESVNEVFHTLRDSVILVALVILLFLQDWKALLLPVIDMAVSLVGTFAVMSLMGFTLNNLTLFGLVLAIGLVVDDSIVVLENIERWLDKGLPVREATIQAMNEITGPILAMTLVLSSVLLPSAFLGGITGQFFRQFALTISVSMIISAINAMTMTPARAAWIFAGRKPGQHGDQGKEALPWWSFALFGGLATAWLLAPTLGAWLGLPAGEEGGEAAPGGLRATLLTWGISCVLFLPGAVAGGTLGWFLIRPVNWALGHFFRGFNWIFERTTQAYGKTVGWCLRLSVIVLLVYVGLIGLTGFGFTRVPSGFVPIQDKGYLVVNIQLPDSASLERTVEVTEAVEKIALDTPGVAHTVAVPGTVVRPERQQLELRQHVRHPQAVPRTAGPLAHRRGHRGPSPRALAAGGPGGARARLRAAGGAGPRQRRRLQADGGSHRRRQLRRAAGPGGQPGRPGEPAARPGRPVQRLPRRTPQLYADIDRTKVRTMGVALTDVFDALQAYLGSYYVNDFNRFGRTWQVNVQADAPFRVDAETVKQLKVRNADGDMVPLGAVVDVRESAGPVTITRYNMFPAATITGSWQPGVSTGDVLRTMEGLSDKELPRSMTYEWTELSYLQKQSSKVEQFRDLRQNPFSAFVLGAVLVFFVLAGLYESWSLPLAVILVVPMCVLCALTGVAVRGMDNNIFTQIGFVVLIGLACKNAILIVEFARDRQQEGASRFDAAVEAARVRLRPIVMTTACFIHMVPPYFATGAGAEMRRSLGTAMLWGAFGVTLFGIFLTPVFYSVVRRLSDRKAVKPARLHRPDTAPAGTIPEGPAWATPGAFHANNGEAEYASLDLRMHPGLGSRRS